MTIYSAIYAHFSSEIFEIFKNAIYAHPKENLHRNPSKHSFFRLRRSKNTFTKQQLFLRHNWMIFITFSCILNEETSNINVFSYKKSLFLALYMAMPTPKFLKILANAIYAHRYICPCTPVCAHIWRCKVDFFEKS